jgi:hypothetical protein
MRFLPVRNTLGSDPEGTPYIGKAGTWLWKRVRSLRNTHLTGHRHLYDPLPEALRSRYPKEKLAITWMQCPMSDAAIDLPGRPTELERKLLQLT